MNRYTLTADGHRWWWGPALAATAGTAAIASIVALPMVGQAMPVPTPRHAPAGTSAYVHTTDDQQAANPVLGQCFLYRAHWNEALDGTRPLCPHVSSTRGAADVAPAVHAGSTMTRVPRPGLDWKP